MKLHKFQSGRVCVSVCGLFFKFNLKQNYNQTFERLKENKLCDLVETKKIAKIPRNIFRSEFFRFSLEITEFFEGATPLTKEEHANFFESTMRKYYRELESTFRYVDWHELYTETIASLFSQEPTVEKYINTKIGAKRYCNTGIHGDLNHNNVLKTKDGDFLIIDWESRSPHGCFFWDLCFYYGNVLRTTSAPGEDILSIVKADVIKDDIIDELLVFYALLKFRSDLLRHNRPPCVSFESLVRRMKKIIEIRPIGTDFLSDQ